jgi:hypothetical protein
MAVSIKHAALQASGAPNGLLFTIREAKSSRYGVDPGCEATIATRWRALNNLSPFGVFQFACLDLGNPMRGGLGYLFAPIDIHRPAIHLRVRAPILGRGT